MKLIYACLIAGIFVGIAVAASIETEYMLFKVPVGSEIELKSHNFLLSSLSPQADFPDDAVFKRAHPPVTTSHAGRMAASYAWEQMPLEWIVSMRTENPYSIPLSTTEKLKTYFSLTALTRIARGEPVVQYPEGARMVIFSVNIPPYYEFPALEKDEFVMGDAIYRFMDSKDPAKYEKVCLTSERPKITMSTKGRYFEFFVRHSGMQGAYGGISINLHLVSRIFIDTSEKSFVGNLFDRTALSSTLLGLGLVGIVIVSLFVKIKRGKIEDTRKGTDA